MLSGLSRFLGLPIDRMAARSDIFDLQCNNIAIPQLAVDREQMVAGYPRTPARVSCIMIKRWHVTPRTPSKCLGLRRCRLQAGAHAERHRTVRQVCHACALRPTSRMKV